MKVIFATCLLLFTIRYHDIGTEANLLQLCDLVDHYKKFKWSIGCLEFVDYGCFCGPGGWGSPADEIDNCCMHHDHCYDRAKRKGKFNTRCHPYVEYYAHNNGSCFDQAYTCQRFVCECDKALARCLTDKKYHKQFINYRYDGHCK